MTFILSNLSVSGNIGAVQTGGQLDVFSTDKIDERIVNNRNAFVMDNQIQKIQRRENWPSYISSEYLDLGLTRRGELYINANGQYIFLVSFPDLSPEKKALLDSLGFIHVYPMYEKDNYSFIKIMKRSCKGHRRKIIE
jgi:hypothetical protein